MDNVYRGELDRIMGADKLARPDHMFGGGGKRDPSPLWDDWYEDFTPTERRQLAPFMGGAVSPDTLATWLHCSVHEAMQQWKTACLLTLRTVNPWVEKARAQARDDDRVSPSDLMASHELAAYLGVETNTVAQWRRRGKLPVADLILTGTEIWTRQTIDASGLVARRDEIEEF